MKRLFYYGMALTAVFGLWSCASDDVAESLSSGDGVTVTLRIPTSIDSKSTFGDENTVELNNLQYSVFEIVDGKPVHAFDGGKDNAFGKNVYVETETLKLGKGKNYKIVFYADQALNGFSSFSEGNLTVNYNNISSNEEKYDAFYGVVAVSAETSSTEVTLKRPFAQLNWGTDDYNEKAIASSLANLTATVNVNRGLYSSMNLLDGTMGEEISTPVKFDAYSLSATSPAGDFPVDGYKLIAMNYLLTGNGTIDCQLDFSNGFSPVKVSAAPVQENYRTNIYGSLLTNPVEFNINVESAFNDPSSNIWFSNGGNVTLTSDMNFSKPVTIEEGQTLNVDLNGHSIAYNGDDRQGFLFIVEGGTLNIRGEGNVYGGKGCKASNAAVVVRSGVANIYGGNYSVGNDADGIGNPLIEVVNGDANIFGGHFQCEGQANGKWYVLNKVNNGNGNITVYGGQFVGQNPADGDDKLGGSFLANGFVSEQNGDTYTVYKPIADASAFDQALIIGGTVRLTSDIDASGLWSNALIIENGITANIDLNGHNITNGFFSVLNATANIYGNGTVTPPADLEFPAISASDGAVVNVYGGEYIASLDHNGDTNSTLIADGGELNIYGGKFAAQKPYKGKYYILNVLNNKPTSKILVYGGEFVGQNPADGDDSIEGTFLAPGYRVETISGNPNTYKVVKAN